MRTATRVATARVSSRSCVTTMEVSHTRACTSEMRPATGRRRRVFPERLPPMTTGVSPLNASNDRPWRTSRLSNRFQTSLTSTIAVIALLSPEEDEKQLGEEEVGDDHPHRDVDDGG